VDKWLWIALLCLTGLNYTALVLNHDLTGHSYSSTFQSSSLSDNDDDDCDWVRDLSPDAPRP